MTKTPDDNSLLCVLVIDDQSHVRNRSSVATV